MYHLTLHRQAQIGSLIPGEGGLAAGNVVVTREGTMRWSLTTAVNFSR